jgi:hypothetical protein
MADDMIDYERAEQFRQKALKLGLIYGPYFRVRGRKFYFDLNHRAISLSQEPAKVFALVKLAREHAIDGRQGEHNDILQLVVPKGELEKDIINWHRVYHTCAFKHPDEYISIKDWLEANGFKTEALSA